MIDLDNKEDIIAKDKCSKNKAVSILIFAIIKRQISLSKASKNSHKKEGACNEKN